MPTDPLWRNLPAVQAGRARVVGGQWFGFDLLEAELVLADLEQVLGWASKASVQWPGRS